MNSDEKRALAFEIARHTLATKPYLVFWHTQAIACTSVGPTLAKELLDAHVAEARMLRTLSDWDDLGGYIG